MQRHTEPTHHQAITQASGFPGGGPDLAGKPAGQDAAAAGIGRLLHLGAQLFSSATALVGPGAERVQLSEGQYLSLADKIRQLDGLQSAYLQAVAANDKELQSVLAEALEVIGLSFSRLAMVVRTEVRVRGSLKDLKADETAHALERLHQGMRELAALREAQDE